MHIRKLEPARHRGRLLAATGLATSLLVIAGAAAAQETSVDEVVVTGSRVSEATVAIGTDQATATVSITSEALLSAPAGITGLKMLESLPGFNVQANDALGMYEFGNSVSVRAFNFQQIGFLLDSIPMGRSDQFGGSPIYRYVDNENLMRVTASAGSGDVALPSYASLGPIVDYITATPSADRGGAFSQMFGSDELRRSFLRLELGQVGGLTGYVSGSVIDGGLWRGPGTIHREHYEGKLRYEFAQGADLVFQTVHNDYFDYDSPSITKLQYAGQAGDIFGRSGRNFAYLGYVPAFGPAGSATTGTNLPAVAGGPPYSNAAYNQYYKFAVNSRQDHLYGLTLNLPVGEAISASATAYYEDKGGYGVSPEAYATSLTNYNAERLIVPGLTAPRGIQYGLSGIDGIRKGITGHADFEAGIHLLSVGGWVEKDDYHRTQARYNVANGHPDGDPLFNEPVHLQKNFVSTRETLSFFVKDSISLLGDALKLELGFKGLDIDYTISGKRLPADYINQRTPTITDNWKDAFLPQVGFVYSFGRDQVFGSYSENMALPRGADDVFAVASPAVPGPEAETAKNLELGVRANRPTFNASFVVYSTSFENRLQSFASPVPGTTTTETFFQNVGGVSSKGAEFSGQWKPEILGGKVYFNGNLSYNVSKFEDNFSTFLIAGKRLPDFPEVVFQGGVTVEPFEGLVANVSARKISDRFTNFVNSESTDGYTIINAYIDMGDGFGAGPFQEIKARVNLDNLLDEDYLGTISTTTNTPATFRPGSHRTIQFTISADF